MRLPAIEATYRFRTALVIACLTLLISPGAAIPGAVTDSRLADAVKNGDKRALRSLLAQRVDPNSAESDGTTALHWAAERDDLEAVEILLRAGANASAVNRYGVAPLSRACLNGNGPIVGALLEAGADPDTTLPEGETALMTAARTGTLAAVEALLRKGASVNTAEKWRGQSALMWAAAEGHADVVRALVKAGANINARSKAGFSALLFAARQGKIAAVTALLDSGADINQTLRITAAPPSRRSAATETLAEPVDGATALVLAVGSGHFELAMVLLERGADPNADANGWTALHNVTWVRKAGTGDNMPPPDGSGNMSSLEIVRELVYYGADVNARMKGIGSLRRLHIVATDVNVKGATPFLMAARTADVELMQLLLALGADPLLPNDDGTTPLQVAAGVGTASPGEDPGSESEVLEAVKLAWQVGGDVNAVDRNGETAMHGVAYKHMPAVVQFLLDMGARIEVWNQKNKYGWTPLTIAEGVQRVNNIRPSPATAAVIRAAMAASTPDRRQ